MYWLGDARLLWRPKRILLDKLFQSLESSPLILPTFESAELALLFNGISRQQANKVSKKFPERRTTVQVRDRHPIFGNSDRRAR